MFFLIISDVVMFGLFNSIKNMVHITFEKTKEIDHYEKIRRLYFIIPTIRITVFLLSIFVILPMSSKTETTEGEMFKDQILWMIGLAVLNQIAMCIYRFGEKKKTSKKTEFVMLMYLF